MKTMPLRRKPPSEALPAPDPWHAFCDAMDEVHRRQAACRTQALEIRRECVRLVAAALADEPINPSTDQRRVP